MPIKRVVLVQLDPDKEKAYAYFTDDITLKKGDEVVVQVRNWYTVGRVVQSSGVSQASKDFAKSWVAQKIIIDHTKPRSI